MAVTTSAAPWGSPSLLFGKTNITDHAAAQTTVATVSTTPGRGIRGSPATQVDGGGWVAASPPGRSAVTTARSAQVLDAKARLTRRSN